MSEASIRLLLTVPAAYRELYDDLENIPPRHRAERIRALALMGLACMASGVSPVAAAQNAVGAGPGPAQVAPQTIGGGSNLKKDSVRKLAGSI